MYARACTDNEQLDLILPEELWDLVKRRMNQDQFVVRYSKVRLSLLDIISGDFFNVYIKTGDVLMVSEGRPHVDNCFTLSQGVLRLDLDKATYERCGLVGKPVSSPGRKHVTTRFG